MTEGTPRQATHSYQERIQNLYTDLTQPTDDSGEEIRELYSFVGIHGYQALNHLNIVFAEFLSSLAFSVQSRVLQEYIRSALANNVVIVPAAGGGPAIHRLQSLSIAVIGLHLLSLIDDYKNVHGDIYVLRSRLGQNMEVYNLPMILPRDPQLKERKWNSQPFEVIGASYISTFRSFFMATEHFRQTISFGYLRAPNQAQNIAWGTAHGAAPAPLGPFRAANMNHMTGGGTAPRN